MVEAGEKLGAAVRTRGVEARARRQRLRWVGATGASFAIDAAFLGLFAYIHTISALVPVVYSLVAVVTCWVTYMVFDSGWNLLYRDPNLTQPLTLVAIAMQLGVVIAAPQIAFPFLVNLFTVFAFAMIWLSVRDSLVVWTVGAAGSGLVFYMMGTRLGVPLSDDFEVFLVWLYFCLVLGRCVMVSVNANEMRVRLANSRGRLGESLEKVQQLAGHDELTGTLNRRALVASLERERVRAERSGMPFSVGMMDLDHFKAVNDSFGHGTGDAVLREFAAIVHATMRATDVFGRYGGEEFLIVLVGTEPPAALEAMERIRTAVAAHDWGALAPGLAQTVSAGVASFRKSGTIEQLLRSADLALYQAKHAGRNRIVASKT